MIENPYQSPRETGELPSKRPSNGDYPLWIIALAYLPISLCLAAVVMIVVNVYGRWGQHDAWRIEFGDQLEFLILLAISWTLVVLMKIRRRFLR